jgi:diaminopimelate epimerase
MSVRFTKMHGAGNDFVVIDRRHAVAPLDLATMRAMADRHTGVGYDQLLTLEAPTQPRFAARYTIYNADGSQAEQCGNGVRCLVAWLARAGAVSKGRVLLESPTRSIECEVRDAHTVRVAMGEPRFAPAEVPFVADRDTTTHAIEVQGQRIELSVVNMGNPHAVLEVADVDTAPVTTLGAALERHARFPQRCNVGFAHVLAADAIRLRVFERGVGETLACGSGACAAVAALARRGRVGAEVAVSLPGGVLRVDWPGIGHTLYLSGPTAFVFEGEWST